MAFRGTGLLIALLAAGGAAAAGSAADAPHRADWLSEARLGVFMHFWANSERELPRVEAFDVPAVARQLKEMGAGYFVLTLGQNAGFYNAPNAAYDRALGCAPGERCAARDLPLELHRALAPEGIRLMLYLPCQAPNRDPRAQRAFGLPEGLKDQPLSEAFARKWAEVIAEWSVRYGDKVAGWWFDGGYAHIGFGEPIAAIYAEAARRGNPRALVTFNPGVKLIRYTQAEDYTAGELNEPFGALPESRWVAGSQWHALTYLGSSWGRRDTRHPDVRWIAWARAVAERGGAVTLDLGPNGDPAAGPVGTFAEAQVAQVRAIRAALPAGAAEPPEPAPADTGRLVVGALAAPIWGDGTRWRTVAPYPERRPLLGFYDEGAPEVTDWEVTWALDHGISFFMPCWYRAAANLGRSPVEPLYGEWVESLARSRHGRRFRFALLWENQNRAACGVASEQDLLENLLPFWIARYFRQPNYLLDDGKPVLAIYDAATFARQLGGEAGAAAALVKMREACVRAGFKGLTVLGQHCWGPLEPADRRLAEIGFDAQFAYHLPTFTRQLAPGDFADAAAVMRAQEAWWRQPGRVPQVPTVSVGWDSRPWGGSFSTNRWQLAPAQFQALCERARGWAQGRGGGTLASRMVLIDSWNEFGEGHFVFPTAQHRFGYLDAVRAAFAPGAGGHEDACPGGPFDSRYQEALRREGAMKDKPAARLSPRMNEGVTLNVQRSTLNAQGMDKP